MQPWEDTGYVSINYGYQVGDRSFQESLTAIVYGEEATYAVDHASSGGGHFDIGGGLRVWRNLTAGVTVTSFSVSAGAAITGVVPHPLFFNRPRTGSSALVDLEHKELGIHFQAAWVMPLNEQISVTVAGGPSLFRVDQSLITAVSQWPDQRAWAIRSMRWRLARRQPHWSVRAGSVSMRASTSPIW